jgi:uncharacterized protein
VILPDVNVLIYAFRKDSEEHIKYHRWLDSVVNGNAVYGISPQVLAAVIRITTNPRIYIRPSHLRETLDFCNVLLQQPHCRIIQPGPRHWTIFSQLCVEGKISGNLIPDAWFAALAIESGCEWITTDGDYSRFKKLNHRPPF